MIQFLSLKKGRKIHQSKKNDTNQLQLSEIWQKSVYSMYCKRNHRKNCNSYGADLLLKKTYYTHVSTIK